MSGKQSLIIVILLTFGFLSLLLFSSSGMESICVIERAYAQETNPCLDRAVTQNAIRADIQALEFQMTFDWLDRQATVTTMSNDRSTLPITPTLAATPTATPMPAVACPGSLVSRLPIQGIARVIPEGGANNVRNNPSLNGSKLGQIQEGQLFYVFDGPRCSDGYAWWQVYHDGIIGWTAEGDDEDYWLEPIGISDSSQVINPAPSINRVFVAYQPFEHGYMFWISSIDRIWVIHETGNWTSHADTWQEGQIATDSSIVPPRGLRQPERGFGKVWRENTAIREELGWALFDELGYTSRFEYHPDNGDFIVFGSDNRQFILKPDGTWAR